MISNPEIERTVLSSLLVDNDLMLTATASLKPEMFCLESHKNIYITMINTYRLNNQFDTTLLLNDLEKDYHNDLIDLFDVNSVVNIKPHIDILLDAYQNRELLKIAEKTRKAIEGGSKFESIKKSIDKNLFKLSVNNTEHFPVSVGECLGDVIQSWEKGSNLGYKTGFKCYDDNYGGFRPGELIIVAGRPGMGKTTFLYNCAMNMSFVYNNIPGIAFNIEMTNVEIIQKMISDYMEIDFNSVVNGKLNKSQMEKTQIALAKFHENDNLFLYDKGKVTVEDMYNIARLYVQKYGIKYMVIDYLQIISNSGLKKGDQRHEVEHKTRELKQVAKELKIIVVTASQLSRAPELRNGDGKRPILADLRDTGAIEQDADVVLFPFRPSKYGLCRYHDKTRLPAKEYEAELIVAKIRKGVPGIHDIDFFGNYSKFKNPEIENEKTF